MFDTLGIRKLIVCGAVTLTTFTAQQLLAQGPLAESLLQITPSTTVQEGDSGAVTFSFTNTGNEALTLHFSSLQSNNTSNPDDFIILTNPVVADDVLAPNSTLDVFALFDTPQPDKFEDGDVGNNVITGTVNAIGATGTENLSFSANVSVADPGVLPVVPESSTLVLVGACALSVCGVGWLRRRRILSKA
jgi:hypothetical protein